jgi:hypothetical protein
VAHGGFSTRGAWATATGTAFTPTSLSGCILWLGASVGITLDSTVLSSGTSPPTVTLSGTLTQALPVRIEITTGGTLGVAVFRWKTDTTSTWTSGVTTAASVALGSTNITANFAAGTYSTNNVYLSRVNAWADQSGNSNNVSQATAGLMPVLQYDSAIGGTSVKFDGTDDYLSRASGGLTGNVAHTFFMRTIYRNVASTGFASLGNSPGATAGGASTIGSRAGQLWAGGTGITVPAAGALTDNATYTLGKTHVVGTTQAYVGSVATGSTAANVFALLAGFMVGALANNSGWSTTAIRTIAMYNRALNSTEIGQLVTYLDAA